MWEWKEINFKDFLTLQRGFDLYKTEYKGGKYPVIGATEIAGYHNSFKVKGPGITVGRTGTIGRPQLIEHNFWPHQDCLFVKDFKGNDLVFAFYVLKALPLSHLDAGGAVPALNRNHLDYIKISTPTSISAQQQIASILSTYDELIDVNNQRIKLLEETARELYKEWFVRMRFPGYKKATFIKGLPNWNVLKFGQIAYFIKGKNPKQLFDNKITGSKLYLNIEAIEGSNNSFCEDFKGVDVIDGEILMIMDGSRSGVVLKGKSGILGSTLSVVRTKNKYELFSSYIYYFLKQNFEWIESNNIGSAIPHANRRFIESISLLEPPTEIIKKFDAVAKPIEIQIRLLEQQNTQLRQIRDRLLPRLISGKLQVKTAQKEANVIALNTTQNIAHVAEDANEYKTQKGNVFFQRRVLAAYIIDRLKDEPTFGHVKLMKLMYLCEHLAEIETASNYHRDAAGPYDNKMIRSIDSQLKKAQWFECTKPDQKYIYKPLAKKDEYKPWFDKYYSDKETGIVGLLAIFGKERTEKAEMAATLYEAYRDLKERQIVPTEDLVVNEVLNNWHDSKKRIEESRWRVFFNWMLNRNWIG